MPPLLLALSLAQAPVTVTAPTDPLGRLSVGGQTLTPFPGYAGPLAVTIARPEPATPPGPMTVWNHPDDPADPTTLLAINKELARLTDRDVKWLRGRKYVRHLQELEGSRDVGYDEGVAAGEADRSQAIQNKVLDASLRRYESLLAHSEARSPDPLPLTGWVCRELAVAGAESCVALVSRISEWLLANPE